jgi:hypothetical protein
VPENPHQNTTGETAGESPGVSGPNYLHAHYRQAQALTNNPAYRFVPTDCGIGGTSIAQLSKRADPDIYNRLLQAATFVQHSAESQYLTYQVGCMFWVQGGQDARPQHQRGRLPCVVAADAIRLSRRRRYRNGTCRHLGPLSAALVGGTQVVLHLMRRLNGAAVV